MESGFAPMSSNTNGLSPATIWTARAGRSMPGSVPRMRLAGGHARPGVPGGHDGVGLAILDQPRRDDDRASFLRTSARRGMLVHPDDLARRDDPDIGRGAIEERR